MAVRTRTQLAGGELSIDPSENVKALSEASAERQDDLRHETNLRVDAELRCVKEIAALRADHAKELGDIRERHQDALRKAESARLDSIRQVDREDVSKTAAAAQQAIATLANTTATVAETLRTNQSNLAGAAETRQQTQYGEMNKRLSALELGQSEGKGRQTVADPMQAEMLSEFKAMRLSFAEGQGKAVVIDPMIANIMAEQKKTNDAILLKLGSGQGMDKMWQYIIAAIGAIYILLKLSGKI